MVVNVQDVNEPPLFLNSHYIAWVSEHANVGEPVHAFISAVDYDEASHNICIQVCHYNTRYRDKMD